MVNEAAKGELKIDYLGGPEVIGGFDQIEAVRTGVLDVTFNVGGYYDKLLPAAHIFLLSRLTPSEERKAGLYDFLQPLHKEIGVFLLGDYGSGTYQYLYTNKAIKRPQELAGLKMRTAAAFDPFMKALGIATVSMPPPDIYTALERGTIEGFVFPNVGFTAFGWQEVTKYCIDHGIYQTNQEILINLDTWERLSQSQRDLLMDVQKQFEPKLAAHFVQAAETERQKMRDAGMEFIKFSPADAKWYTDLGYNVKWEQLKKGVSPEVYTKLRKLVGAG
jgi:TRAP-type C4-dicarboxylate transport system substrate-binding protein